MRLFEFVEVKKKAIFTAGLPGAGKSSVVNKLLGHSGIKIIDVDKFYMLDVAKGKEPGDYEKYSEKAGKLINMATSQDKSVILDGTGTNVARYAETKKTLEDMGYQCMLLYVATDLERAEERAQARAEATGRTVDVASYYQRLHKSFDNLTRLFDTAIVMIDNNPTRPELADAHRKINRFLRATASVTEAIDQFAANRVKEWKPGIKIDFDNLYGKAFKIVDPNGDASREGYSIVTPFSSGWNKWKERPEHKDMVKSKINNSGWLSEPLYNQILSAAEILKR